jgi:hypothetical protein
MMCLPKYDAWKLSNGPYENEAKCDDDCETCPDNSFCMDYRTHDDEPEEDGYDDDDEEDDDG